MPGWSNPPPAGASESKEGPSPGQASGEQKASPPKLEIETKDSLPPLVEASDTLSDASSSSPLPTSPTIAPPASENLPFLPGFQTTSTSIPATVDGDSLLGSLPPPDLAPILVSILPTPFYTTTEGHQWFIRFPFPIFFLSHDHIDTEILFFADRTWIAVNTIHVPSRDEPGWYFFSQTHDLDVKKFDPVFTGRVFEIRKQDLLQPAKPQSVLYEFLHALFVFQQAEAKAFHDDEEEDEQIELGAIRTTYISPTPTMIEISKEVNWYNYEEDVSVDSFLAKVKVYLDSLHRQLMGNTDQKGPRRAPFADGCSICQDTTSGDMITTACKHKFHVNCFSQIRKQECPNCKAKFTPSEMFERECRHQGQSSPDLDESEGDFESLESFPPEPSSNSSAESVATPRESPGSHSSLVTDLAIILPGI